MVYTTEISRKEDFCYSFHKSGVLKLAMQISLTMCYSIVWGKNVRNKESKAAYP